MPSLADIQEDFARAMRDPARPAPASIGTSSTDKASRRFNVYRNNMVVSLTDALMSTFPAVHRLVGDEYFKSVARAYVDQFPPLTPVLLLYGESFGEFLDLFPSASGVPYLGDVARLEWARINALHAPDAEPVGIDVLAAIPEAELQSVGFTMHPSLSVIVSKWPVVSLWSASVNADNADVDMKVAENAAVIRPALRVGVHKLDLIGGTFLVDLIRGSSLGDAAQRATEARDDFDLASHLQFIFEAGAVTALNILNENKA